MGGETQRHLHELLREDQEPFLLEDYIANRGLSNSLLQARTQVQLRGPKSVSSAAAAVRFCRSVCFFTSSSYSPDLRRGSTLFDFPARKPCKGSSAAPIFLRRAAAASKKVQRHPSPPMPGFGLFGSVLKKLTRQNRSRKHDIGAEDKPRPTAASGDYWPESNEEKSPSSGSEFERDVFGDFDSSSGNNSVCESPFRFVLQTSPSSENRRTPESPLPSASSPISNKEKVNHEAGGEEGGEEEEEEEDKEQNSPVSVLDPPFNDDDDDTHGDEYDLDGSYIAVQRTKQKLLQQLQRLERLAGLDPIELEQSMEGEGADDQVGVESALSDGEKDGNEKLSNSSFQQMWNIPMELRRLVRDIIVEETGKFEDRSCNSEAVKERVWDRLECWEEVESNTIDMMAEMDLRKELNGWNGGSQQHLGDVAMAIECAIFGLLVEELSGEPNT